MVDILMNLQQNITMAINVSNYLYSRIYIPLGGGKLEGWMSNDVVHFLTMLLMKK